METVYEVVKIKQVIKEVEEDEIFFVHSPQDGAKVAAHFIGDEDREVFKSAILNNSASIEVSHQHPSQDVSPSREDFEVTKRLDECGRILGIELLDHIIVNAKAEYYSMKEKGQM
ncbi:JAB domain-containing protein [Pseudobacillus badius]|uniref:JAB domain-containing protein n=1 Tax=Bacillus badius TaxID=1455 RepID=UPI003D34F0D2